MLVLTRRIGERVRVGEDIEITVLDVRGDHVRLGIQAPRDTRIQRAEIVAAVESENIAATQSSGDVESALVAAIARRASTSATD